MPSNVLDPFFYPGTRTHRNRLGIRDEVTLGFAEFRAYVVAEGSLPPAGFVPDMRGLKGVHRHLFGDVYEWAGCARHEPMTVEGEFIELPVHQLSKGAVAFGSSEEGRVKLPRALARRRDALVELRDRGTLTPAKWCEHTAEAVVAINHAHPFIEGNGRAMRHFIGCSAEYFGFVCRMPRGPRWMEACEEARRQRSAEPMVGLLAQQALSGLGEEERERLRSAAPSELSDDDLRLLTAVPDPPPLHGAVKTDPAVQRADEGVAGLAIQHRARREEARAAGARVREGRQARRVRTWLADRGIMDGWLRKLEQQAQAVEMARETAKERLGAARREAYQLRKATAARLSEERTPGLARRRALREEWDRRRGRSRGHGYDMDR